MSFVHQHRRKLHIGLTLLRIRTVTPVGSAPWIWGAAGCRRAYPRRPRHAGVRRERYPHIERHVSVQASATNEGRLTFIIAILTLHAWCCRACVDSSGETTGAGHACTTGSLCFGSLCIMSEGRCYLSSYLTVNRPTPSVHVLRLASCAGSKAAGAGIPPERSADRPLSGRRNAGYPTLCKGRYLVDGERYPRWKNPPVSIPWNCCRS